MTTNRQDIDFVQSVISTDLLANAIEWIAKNLSPEDVFDKEQLVDWANDNGFISEDSIKKDGFTTGL